MSFVFGNGFLVNGMYCEKEKLLNTQKQKLKLPEAEQCLKSEDRRRGRRRERFLSRSALGAEPIGAPDGARPRGAQAFERGCAWPAARPCGAQARCLRCGAAD